jgi:hypothetical protein
MNHFSLSQLQTYFQPGAKPKKCLTYIVAKFVGIRGLHPCFKLVPSGIIGSARINPPPSPKENLNTKNSKQHNVKESSQPSALALPQQAHLN